MDTAQGMVIEPAAEPGAGLDVAVLTDVGTSRDHNEDACGWIAEGPVVVAVADGVSSGPGGEVASAQAVEALLRAWREEPAKLGAGQRLYRAVQMANIAVYDRAIAVPELLGMATTLTCAAFDAGAATIVHVGDSRCYRLRGGELEQLTKDHTVAAEKARFGILSKEELRGHPDSSLLQRSLGRELIVNRDQATHPLSEGDAFLLCSDGLYNVLDDRELARILAETGDAAAACRALVQAANACGTGDNLTAAVVRVTGAVPARPAPTGLMAQVRRLIGRP
jgi:serine/threonine protein phosphatase PrpC